MFNKQHDMKKTLHHILIGVFIVVMVKVYCDLKTSRLIQAILDVESGKKKISRVNYKSLMYIMKKGTDEAIFFSEMGKLGWHFVDNYGHGYIFEKDGEELFTYRKCFFNLYDVFSIKNEDYFVSRTSELL